MKSLIATLDIIDEDDFRRFSRRLPEASWSYAWMKLKETGQIALVEIHIQGFWTFASVDVADQAHFNEIVQRDSQFYNDKTHEQYQGEVFSAMTMSGVVNIEDE